MAASKGSVKISRLLVKALGEALRDGAFQVEISESDLPGLIDVKVHYDDQRDGQWVERFLLDEQGGRVKVRA